MNRLTSDQIDQFQKLIYDFYTTNKRDFVWRENITPYRILVSEVMLQQTQTARVIPKFENWILQFPDFASLAAATNHQVLTAWQGLGYNRRGLALGTIAQNVMHNFGGNLPQDPAILQTFPAIGPNTAGSICAFAFNLPTIFIETNIRTVYTHHFFQGQTAITDKQLLTLIEQTVDHSNSRAWYYALMDYGVHLKQKLPAINAKSKHYKPQSRFIGSKRQLRGAIIKILTQEQQIDIDLLEELLTFELPDNKHNFGTIIETLIKEKVIVRNQNYICL